jgi:uncharacterized protein (DUF58 family)
MVAEAARTPSSPVAVTLADLVRLRSAGESLKIAAPRVRVAAEGGHLSPYKGRGVEFDESRPYQPGDDLRTMDWRVTARTGKPHTKVFREERNRPVFVWLDLRRPMLFATARSRRSAPPRRPRSSPGAPSRTATGWAGSCSPRASTTSTGPRSAPARP